MSGIQVRLYEGVSQPLKEQAGETKWLVRGGATCVLPTHFPLPRTRHERRGRFTLHTGKQACRGTDCCRYPSLLHIGQSCFWRVVIGSIVAKLGWQKLFQ